MNKALVGLLISLGFLVPALASASATITSVTLNGGSSVQVNPGANIQVSVTGLLTEKTKWKGTQWGINSGTMTPTCANTKNAKDGTRNNETGSFVETFTIKAPGQPGLYNASFLADEANNCGRPLGTTKTLSLSVRVGTNTVPPVIAAHSDISVQLTQPAAGAQVTYINPPATDHFGNLLQVACAPASGTFFALGNTTVTCTAMDSWGNNATPSLFVVSILPPADLTAPVIAPHADISVVTTNAAGTAVSYGTPTATDNVDATVAVLCAPASGSNFAVGTTTVTCLAQDAAGNQAQSTFAVGVALTVTAPPEDTTAPIIAPHADVHATTEGTEASVEYTTPLASDNVDATVAVSCSPASGSTFALGTTTITCTASDAAGNDASSAFFVVVTQEIEEEPDPELYTMIEQETESDLCGEANHSWRFCDADGTYGFTDDFGPTKTIDLGQGSEMGEGVLQTVTIAKDPSEAYGQINLFHPWDITISCYTDASHTEACADWSEVTDDANESSDGKYWTADFSALNRTFLQDAYYVMTIDDTGWETPAYGSAALQEPYWEMVGLD